MNRPDPLPRVEVSVDGRPLDDAAAHAVTHVVLRQALGVASQCEVTLADPPGPDVPWAPGAEVRVTGGERGFPPFEGRLAAVEHAFEGDAGRIVRLRAYDRLDGLARARHVRVLEHPTLHDLANALAQPASLRAEGGENVRLPRQLIQHRESDLELLRAWAGRHGHYLACHDGVLHLVRLAPGEPHVTLDRAEGGWRARFERSDVGAPGSSEVVGWDASTLERRLGAWASADADGGPPLRRTNRLLRAQDEEEARSRAEGERRDAGRLVAWASGPGDLRVRPGATVALQGFGAAFAAPRVVVEAEHALDGEAGFTTTFHTDPPTRPRPHEATEVTVARVTDTRDPQDAGRVRVALEAYGDVTSGWLPVLIAGAGPDKGLTIYPEVDDVVLMLLAGADPSAGIVLGGLYGTTPSADHDAAGRRPRPYTLRTAGGQRLRLDDQGALARLENADGSYLELTADEVVLHAARDLRIEAPGRTLVLGADAIDMRSA